MKDNEDKKTGTGEVQTDYKTIKNPARGMVVCLNLLYSCSVACPQQQWFRQRASVLRYTYFSCLVILS